MAFEEAWRALNNFRVILAKLRLDPNIVQYNDEDESYSSRGTHGNLSLLLDKVCKKEMDI